MSSTAVQYAGALRHTGCTLSDLQHTADYLTDCAPLWDALCSPAVSAREKKAVLSRLPDFDAMGELKHFYLLLADKTALRSCRRSSGSFVCLSCATAAVPVRISLCPRTG
ncbi:MAG: hypothetical protein ACLT4C_08720 [Butyricicoccus sp.]